MPEQYRFWQSVLSLCSPHLRRCFMHIRAVVQPYSPRRHCQLPVSGRRMQRFLQFRLGCHGLPIATGRLAGAGHVDKADRVCLACNSGAVSDEKHFECTALAT